MNLKSLKKIRTKKKMTQRELSEKSGVTVNTISSAERGLNVSPDTAQAIARALNIEVSVLTK